MTAATKEGKMVALKVVRSFSAASTVTGGRREIERRVTWALRRVAAEKRRSRGETFESAAAAMVEEVGVLMEARRWVMSVIRVAKRGVRGVLGTADGIVAVELC